MKRWKRNEFSESSLARIWKQVSEHDSGTISAFRYARNCGEGQRYTRSENESKNHRLKSQLLALGYGVTPIDGVYIENYDTKDAIEVREDSYIVIDLKDSGKLKNTLIALGTQYEQDSITYSKPSGEYYLISTNKCPQGYPGKGKIGVQLKLGKSFFGKDGEFHSKIRNRPFVFESITQNRIDRLIDYSIPEIRSIKYFAEEADKIQYSICKLK